MSVLAVAASITTTIVSDSVEDLPWHKRIEGNVFHVGRTVWKSVEWKNSRQIKVCVRDEPDSRIYGLQPVTDLPLDRQIGSIRI